MRIKDANLYNKLNDELIEIDKLIMELPGLNSDITRHIFVMQIIDSIRRVKFAMLLNDSLISDERANPNSTLFDPLKAAVLFKRKQSYDEAFWLVFLFVHFGKNAKSGWQLVRDIYGALGSSKHWNWSRISSNPDSFHQWLKRNYSKLTSDGIHRAFGNHRKYESLNPASSKSTSYVLKSYVMWVGPNKSHLKLVQNIADTLGNEPRILFENLYNSMNKIERFGRLAKFDYLTMVAKLGLANIEPGHTFIKGSTGPMQGAQLLFNQNQTTKISNSEIKDKLITLERHLSIGPMGMQVLEDAICNWQKTPTAYKYFAG